MNKIATLLLLFALAGCSALKDPPSANQQLRATYEKDRSIPNAISLAESLRDAYAQRSADMRIEEKYNGLALIGMGMVTGDLVARGVGKSETLGLGLGGVGLYSSNNWANPISERQIYAYAAKGVHCAISAIEPLRPAAERLNSMRLRIASLKTKMDALNVKLAGFVGSEEPRVVLARNAAIRALAAHTAGEEAVTYLDSAGPSLVTAIGGMRIDVEVQLVRSSADYGTLVASLIQQKVLPATAPLTLPDSKVKESGGASLLVQDTAQLDAESFAVEQFVTAANKRPSAADLQSCRVDPAGAGVTMKVEPSMVSLKAGDRTVALVSGGAAAYKVLPIVDAAVADQLVFNVASNGIITIEAKSGAKPATYTAYVLDGAKGRETLIVTVTAAPPAPEPATNAGTANSPANGSSAPAAACAKPDPAVKELQEGLRKLGITKVKLDPVDANEVELVVDSCAGKVTKAAVRKFYTDIQKLPADDVQKDEAKLIQEGMADVKAKLAEKK